MGGGEAKSVDPALGALLCSHLEEVGEPPPRIHVPTPGVDVLAQQSHFPVPPRTQLTNLLQDAFRGSRLLDAPSGRYNAVRAMLVTAVDDIHPRADIGISPCLSDVLHDVSRICGHYLVSPSDVLEEVPQSVCVLRPHHEVHLGHPPQKRLRLLLGYATSYNERHILPRSLPGRIGSQLGVDLLLRPVTDAACVQHDDISLPLFLRLLESEGLQLALHSLAVCLVHLTTHRLHQVPKRPPAHSRSRKGGCGWQRGI
mmetsp:Transcript_37902/g.74533  ORF Transcript_37902/g.74533 Transcript_37902/m.74533 type:complete len:256 (-) Transcript_37902:102-869(-)